MIRIEECKKGHIYSLQSRNLDLGVFDGQTGFIGIRTKFQFKYLDTEYHYDGLYENGTAKPLKEIGILPHWIPVKEKFDVPICGSCGRACIAIPIGEEAVPVRWEHIPWHYQDQEEQEFKLFVSTCEKVRPIVLSNSYLFEFLEKLSLNT